MKKLFRFFIIILAVFLAAYSFQNRNQLGEYLGSFGEKVYRTVKRPCSEHFRYSLGNIDHRFGISQEELISTLSEAGAVWSDAAGKELFLYDPESPFKVNLIYDDRQLQSVAEKELRDRLAELEKEREAVVEDYDRLSDSVKKRLDRYNSSLTDYRKKLHNYNEKVSRWNLRGGAPEEEFNQIKEEKEDLEDIFSDLEKERKIINEIVGKTNSLIKKENSIVSDYNSSLGTYERRYGNTREFDKGLYDGREINIYQFHDQNDLRLALAHEFGHALGIDHVSDPKSVMHYLLGDQELENIHLTKEDTASLKAICGIGE